MAEEEITSEEEQTAANKQQPETETPETTETAEQQEATPEEILQQELENTRQQAQENLDKALRAQAEMENLRRRTSRDIENAHKYALDKFVDELLPVMDSMELGIEASNSTEGVDSLREGMELTLKKFQDVLKKFGVIVIDPAGEKFNPEQHQAVSTLEQEGVESGTVVAVMQKGYELNERLVRPAMVVVAK